MAFIAKELQKIPDIVDDSDDASVGIDPNAPTTEKPGSEGKILVLTARASVEGRKHSLHLDADRKEHIPSVEIPPLPEHLVSQLESDESVLEEEVEDCIAKKITLPNIPKIN